MARLALLLLLGAASGQRRRERRPAAGTKLFAAREEPAPLVGQDFMPDFEWSGPDWGFADSSWGSKEPRTAAAPAAPVALAVREYAGEAERRGGPVRHRWRHQEQEGRQQEVWQQEGRQQEGRQQEGRQQEVWQQEGRPLAQGRSEMGRRRRPAEGRGRPAGGARARAGERGRPRQEGFAPPSRVEEVRPVGLSRSQQVRVAEEESQHPGSISLGLFGAGDLGAGPGPTERPGLEQGWGGRGAGIQPTHQFQLRPLEARPAAQRKIRPTRWRPQTQRSVIGSPFFDLEYDEPSVEAPAREEPSGRPEPSWPAERRPPQPPAQAFTPSTLDTVATPRATSARTVFLPTLNPFDSYSRPATTAPPVPSTTERATSWTSSYSARARDSERDADRAFHAKKEMDQEEEEEVEEAAILASVLDELAAHQDDPEEEDTDEEAGGVVINRELLEGRRRVTTEAPVRMPWPTPSHPPAPSRPPTHPRREDLYDPQREDLTAVITNLSEENHYSKTLIRKQKTVPRKATSAPVVATEDNTELSDENEENRIVDNIGLGKGVQEIDGRNDRYAKSHIRLMKPKDNGNRDYSKLTFKDIRAQIPVPKLKKILNKHGFSISDVFSKNIKALEVVDRAMRSKSYLKDEDEKPMTRPKASGSDESSADREDSPRRIDWRKDKVKLKKTRPVADIDAEIEAEAAEMDLKSLMKKISPMSLSEVLQEVGFSLPDVMQGNKQAIKGVLRYHRQVTQPEDFLEMEREEAEEDTEKDASHDDPFKDLDIEIKMWNPPSVEDDATVTESPAEEESRPTRKPFVPTRKKNGVSSVDLFKKFRKFNADARQTVSSTTTKPTTPSANLVRSTTLIFGDRTTQRGKEKFLPTQEPRRKANPVVKTRQRVLNKFGFDRFDIEEEEGSEDRTDSSENVDYQTTTPYDASLNITLTNLNMTASDVIDRKNLTVPGIDTLFQGITKDKAEVIYGAKRDPPKRKKEVRPAKKQEFINTDFGGGGARFRNSWGQEGRGGGSWGGGGRIVTNRRTSSTTRAPMTYFGPDEPIGELSSSTNLDTESHDLLLSGEIEGVEDYDYYPYDYEPTEVPAGVKSALIASSVVGGLAVSIFLCIFMLCLWKQMKNKLRMSMEYEEPRKAGLLAGLCCRGAGQQAVKKEGGGGYFHKSPPSEQHYSTTSSEEY